jgi:hypothetical protein
MGAQKKRTIHIHSTSLLSTSGSVDLVYELLGLFRVRGFENLAWYVKMSTFEREGAHERRTASSFSTYLTYASSFEVPFTPFQASLLEKMEM